MAGKTIRSLFDEYLGDIDAFFTILSVERKTPLYRRESLIIFGEVQ